MIQHTIKSELKGTLTLGLPLIFSQSMAAFSPFISTAMVARLGQDALAANVLVYSAFWALSILFVAMFNAVGVLISHQYGAKNEKAIREIVGQAFLLSIMTSIIVMIILACAPYYLSWHKQPSRVEQLAHELLRSILWTVPGLMVWGVIQQCLQGMGNTKFIFVSNLINIPLEILLIYALIFGKFGLPACGISGVGYGLAVSFTLALTIIIIYLVRTSRYRKLNLFSEVGKLHVSYLKELIKTGLPMGFMAFVELSTLAVLALWMAEFSATMLAAHQILMQYLGFFIVLIFGVAQTVAIRVGHAVGRGDAVGVHYATYVGMALSFLCASILAFTFYFFPKVFLSIDINVHDPAMAPLVRVATQFLTILSVLYLVGGVRLVIGYGALRGLKDLRFTMLVSMISFWVMGLAFSFLFGFVFRFQGTGLWWGLTFGVGIGAVMVVIRWHYLIKRIDLTTLI